MRIFILMSVLGSTSVAQANPQPTPPPPLIDNPASFTTIEQLIIAVLGVVVTIAVPIIVLFIIYAGFLYVTARGNQEQLRQATRAITYAIIGALLVLGAVALAGVIENLILSL